MESGLTFLKLHLNIESTYTGDDILLQAYLDVAKEAVEQYLNYTLASLTTVPLSLHQSIVLLAAHFYLNRNIVSFANGTEIPLSFRWLLDPYKNLIAN